MQQSILQRQHSSSQISNQSSTTIPPALPLMIAWIISINISMIESSPGRKDWWWSLESWRGRKEWGWSLISRRGSPRSNHLQEGTSPWSNHGRKEWIALLEGGIKLEKRAIASVLISIVAICGIGYVIWAMRGEHAGLRRASRPERRGRWSDNHLITLATF